MLYLTFFLIFLTPQSVEPQALPTEDHIHELISKHHFPELQHGIYEYYFSNGTFHTKFKGSSSGGSKEVPPNFDAREHWPKCKSLAHAPVTGKCIAPLAQTFISAINDRTCIKTKGKVQTEFSKEDFITCCTSCKPVKDMCSDTKNIFEATKYWLGHGLVSGGAYKSNKGCKPYSDKLYTKDKNTKIECEKKCTNSKYSKSYEEDLTIGKRLKMIITGSPTDVKYEIMTSGPVISYAALPESFFSHKEGIFRDTYGPLVGVVPIKIFGWGKEDNVNYWWMALPSVTNEFSILRFVKMMGKTQLSRMEKIIFVLIVGSEDTESTTETDLNVGFRVSVSVTLLVLVNLLVLI